MLVVALNPRQIFQNCSEEGKLGTTLHLAPPMPLFQESLWGREDAEELLELSFELLCPQQPFNHPQKLCLKMSFRSE